MTSMTVPMPPLRMSIRVAVPRGYRLRMWLMSALFSVAAAIAPANVTVDADIRAE
jgi:hypothetical protein